jgi:hypothetical protein
MSIAINRDVGFWLAVLQHPAVARNTVVSGREADLAIMLADPKMHPLASEHGGMFLFQRDPFGRVFELHTAFVPEGWGREALFTGLAVAERMFLRGAELIFTVEVANNPKSRPPLSFGWQVAGPFAFASELAAEARTWVLTHKAWSASPARSRMCRQPHYSPH